MWEVYVYGMAANAGQVMDKSCTDCVKFDARTKPVSCNVGSCLARIASCADGALQDGPPLWHIEHDDGDSEPVYKCHAFSVMHSVLCIQCHTFTAMHSVPYRGSRPAPPPGRREQAPLVVVWTRRRLHVLSL